MTNFGEKGHEWNEPVFSIFSRLGFTFEIVKGNDNQGIDV